MKHRTLALLLLTVAALLLSALNLCIGHLYHGKAAAAVDSGVTSAPGRMDLPRPKMIENANRQQARRTDELSVFQSPSALKETVAAADARPRPPLESIVQGWNITGDASWLLDFSIVGFPKCGTSTLMFHLQSHPEIQIFSDERCDLAYNQQARLIKDLYYDFPPDQNLKRAIKCPMDLENTKLGMRNYNNFFPKTDFIVGIRHPILWYVTSHCGSCKTNSYPISTSSHPSNNAIRLLQGLRAFTTFAFTISFVCHLLRS